MPVSRNAHHAQLFATPCSRTRLVTRFGVSVENVVATMETPTSHHGAARPEVKNSAVLEPARRARTIAGRKETAIDTTTMSQSIAARCIQETRSAATAQAPRQVRTTPVDPGIATGATGMGPKLRSGGTSS